MRRKITIKSQYDFEPIEIVAEECSSYFLISRYSESKIPKNQGYRFVAKNYFGETVPVIVK